MKATQTAYFMEDVKHYTRIATEWKNTTRADEIRQSIHRLEKLRGKDYVKALAGKCNQKLKLKFYNV